MSFYGYCRYLFTILIFSKYYIIATSSNKGVFFISQPPFLLSLFTHKSNLSSIEYSNATVSDVNSTFKQFFGLGLAILAAFLVALATILLKKLNNSKVHFSINIIYPAMVGIPITFVISSIIFYFDLEKRNKELYKDTEAVLWQISYVLISAVSNLLTQLFFNIAINYEDATKLSIVRISDLFFTFFFQTLILNIYADLFSIVGALLIFVSTFLVILYKIIEKKYNKKNDSKSSCEKFIFYKI